MKKLTCPHCGAPVEEAGIHADLGIAKCQHCRAVLDLLPLRAAAEGGPAPRRRSEVPVPERFSLEKQGDRLAITWRWFNWGRIFILLFCLFWDGFLVLWYGSVLGAKGRPEPVMLLVPLLHLAVGIGVTWYGLAGLLNTTRLEIERGFLHIRHGPIPWFGNRDLPVKQLQQLFVREIVHRSKNGTSYTYNLMAQLKPHGQELKLITLLDKPEQAFFLEQRIEDHLGIVDVPVDASLLSG